MILLAPTDGQIGSHSQESILSLMYNKIIHYLNQFINLLYHCIKKFCHHHHLFHFLHQFFINYFAHDSSYKFSYFGKNSLTFKYFLKIRFI